MRRGTLYIGLVAAAGLAAGVFLNLGGPAGTPHYRLAKVARGAIAMTVAATGKLNPITTVRVGSQISGQVTQLLVDFNTPVQEGQVLARIDPASFEARVMAARAELDFAKATLAMQKAALAELSWEIGGTQAALKEAGQELQRAQGLQASRLIPQSEMEKATAARDQAHARLEGVQAKVPRQQAQVETARATVRARQAALRDRELDLTRTVIRSPLTGVVIQRDVDPGQTVAASLQAPVLFTIAQDIGRMQVEVSVDEADIGRIRAGQKVRFTVDAYPQREFSGEVTQVRKAPREVSNVVTYTVIVGAANPDQALFPGMTANVEIVVGQRGDALKVPNAALRFRPPGAGTGGPPQANAQAGGGAERARARLARLTERLGLSPAQRQEIQAIYRETGQKMRELRQGGEAAEQPGGQPMGQGGGMGGEAVRQLREQAAKRVELLLTEDQRGKFRLMRAEAQAGGNSRGQIWVRDETGGALPVAVRVGISDGTFTEIVGGPLAEGAEIIVGMGSAAESP